MTESIFIVPGGKIQVIDTSKPMGQTMRVLEEDEAIVADALGRPRPVVVGDVSDTIHHSDIVPLEGLLRKTAAETYTAVKTNLAASSDPTSGDDSGDGYARLSFWYNTSNLKLFVCIDPALGAAVWKEFSFV